MGIDPGIAITGYGVIQTDRTGKLLTRCCGAIKTPAHQQIELRLDTIYQGICEVITQFSPEYIAIEELFFNRNVSSAIVVGQARGVAILAAAHHKLPVAEYTPLQVKQAVTGVGRAPKDQVGFMVRLLLGLSEVPKPDDVADALAVAICHVHNGRGWGKCYDSHVTR